MAHTQQTRTADVAKTSDCDPSDNKFMDAIGKEFERSGRGDARNVDAESHSVHRLVNVTNDSEILGSLHRFSLSFQEFLRWVVRDMNRSDVPMLGDHAAALLAGLCEADQRRAPIARLLGRSSRCFRSSILIWTAMARIT